MALNPELIQFFIERIKDSNSNTIQGNIAQLFEHLNNEVKDNPVFNAYKDSIPKWKEWLDKVQNSFAMPSSFEEAKQLAYIVYLKTAYEPDVFNFLFEVTGQDNFEEAIKALNQTFLQHFIKALDDIANANPEYSKSVLKKVKGKNVFIIHGHDSSLKTELQLLLKTGGVPYIVLHEEADRGRTVIDKLEDESGQSNFAIAVLSPDDLLQNGVYRARQNVILEIGYFMGLLGKDRVRLLVKGDIDIPSDLYGILYEKYDEAGSWKARIAKELIAAGVFIDLPAIVNQY
jgi:predicted nucleotide-binding protein